MYFVFEIRQKVGCHADSEAEARNYVAEGDFDALGSVADDKLLKVLPESVCAFGNVPTKEECE